MEWENKLNGKLFRIARKSRLRLLSQTDSPARLLTASVVCSMKRLRNLPSFQRSIGHGQYLIQLHAWRSPESDSFARFIYEKAAERLLRHFTGADENEVLRKARVWCDENS